MPRAFSYLRFSTPEQMRGDSFRRQSALAAEYARHQGLTLDTELTFNDLGVSAYRGRNAEAGRLGDFLVAVEDGLVPRGSFLLVESLDRISRQAARKALRVLEDIVERGVTVVTLNDGRAYTAENLDTDPMSLLLALLTFIRANEESLTKSRRLVAAWAAKRDKAADRPLTSICPAWLRLDPTTRCFEIIPERAAIVRRIYAETLAGRGQHAIAQGLNHDGVPVFGHQGRAGKHWHRSYIAKLLDGAAVVGTYVPHRMEHSEGKKRRIAMAPVADYFPAVVPSDTFSAVQALRDGTRQPLRGRHASGSVANVLGGLARCPQCDGSMTLVTKGGNWRYLVCAAAKAGAGCHYRGVRYGDVELAVLGSVGHLFMDCPSGGHDDVNLLAVIDHADLQLEHLGAAMRQLIENAENVSSPTIARRIVELEREMEQVRSELDEQSQRRDMLMPTRLHARLDDLAAAARAKPLDRGRLNAALRVLFTGVVVDRRSGFLVFRWQQGDESRVLFGWPEDDGAGAVGPPQGH